ncbi:uncharacterized protein DS421_8g237200 [Arachis hypogaea]|nr:uncharacterized protein DS421_8g237200 [Arachis hypogaea]
MYMVMVVVVWLVRNQTRPTPPSREMGAMTVHFHFNGCSSLTQVLNAAHVTHSALAFTPHLPSIAPPSISPSSSHIRFCFASNISFIFLFYVFTSHIYLYVFLEVCVKYMQPTYLFTTG